MSSESLWLESVRPKYRPVSGAARYDVVVIGGGITGLTAAYFLKQAGKSVCVLEKGRIANGETGHTSAHLAYTTDLKLSALEKSFGEDGARLAWQAGALAIDAIETMVTRHKIACDFQRVPGVLCGAIFGEKDESDALQEESEFARRLGFNARFQARGPILGIPAVIYADEALFDPVKYLAGLAKLIHGDGCAIFEESEVTEVEEPSTVVANDQRIAFDYLVVATHVPLMGKAGLVSATLFQTKLYPYSTYVVGATLLSGTLPVGLYDDTADPYYYLRVHQRSGHDYAVFGGADHKTGQVDDTEQRYAVVESALLNILPNAMIDRRWSGQVIETPDGLPYIGETAPRQFAATGYAGNGLTFGTLAGIMARDAVMGQENPWQKLFSPERKKIVGGGWDYLKENLDYPYHLIAGWLAQGHDHSTRSVKRGEGKVLTIEGKKVACHRSETGDVTMVSAVCTHMGCIVRFNPAEQTWDCPCHGSRFLPTGEVIGGPAEEGLKVVRKARSWVGKAKV